MMDSLPAPLVSGDCDCTDLDGFMLNVERLMASELVALGGHEAIAAALFVWCRAWKQVPAASLPDDDRVNAAFARLPLARFKKLKDDIMRGFVKCSDGRLYHRTLAAEATQAYGRKLAFRKRRESDNERLKKWREKRHDTHDETYDETRCEREGQGQGQGQGLPISQPIPKPERKNLTSFVLGRGGKKMGGVTLQDPQERIARFQKTIADAIGRNGWNVVAAAADPSDPEYERALALCKSTAEGLGKGWPQLWPKPQRQTA